MGDEQLQPLDYASPAKAEPDGSGIDAVVCGAGSAGMNVLLHIFYGEESLVPALTVVCVSLILAVAGIANASKAPINRRCLVMQ